MPTERSDLRKQVLKRIEGVLAGTVGTDEAAAWATLKMSELTSGESAETQEDYIIADGLGALMMLSENEPEEYRTTTQELKQSRSYLLGEEPFPPHRLPKQWHEDEPDKT